MIVQYTNGGGKKMENIPLKIEYLESQKEFRKKSNLKCGWGMFSYPEWGEEFEHSEEFSNQGWDFKLYKQYRFWEYEGVPGRTGTVYLRISKAPGETLAQKLFNDNPEQILSINESIKQGSKVIPMQERINLTYDRLEQLAKSNEIFEICEKSLEEFYKEKIGLVEKYGTNS